MYADVHGVRLDVNVSLKFNRIFLASVVT